MNMWIILTGCDHGLLQKSLLNAITYLVTVQMHNFLIGGGYIFRSYFAALNVPQFMVLKLRTYNTSNFQQWINTFLNELRSEVERYSSVPSGSIFAFPNAIEELWEV
jgi:hypothetical protein